jgi:hypothetical protein
MSRFIPTALLGLVSIGLLIGEVSPAWWITGLVAIGLGLATALGSNLSIGGRSLRLAPYLPAAFVGLAALGLLAADASPAWWITGLVAVGFAVVVFMATYSESEPR